MQSLRTFPDEVLVVSVGQYALIEPEVPHHVRIIWPVVFQLEFYRAE